MYKFSENTTAEFYGRKFYEIQDESGKCVAYSERVFEIPEAVKFLGGGKCLIFEKAVIWGGDFHGGDFHGGYFHGGDFRGGYFYGGNYEITMLQIQGNKHFCYAYFEDDGSVCLGIGCERHTIKWWIENYSEIGDNENYTYEQIDEYKMYIDLFAARYPSK